MTDKHSSGLQYSPLNLIYLPSAHENYFNNHPALIISYFNNHPALIISPIMDLEDVKSWQENQEYWVMVIAGCCNDFGATQTQLNQDIFRESRYDGLSMKGCTKDEILKATRLLGAFVKAHETLQPSAHWISCMEPAMAWILDDNCCWTHTTYYGPTEQ
jgi:hypothetical protein